MHPLTSLLYYWSFSMHSFLTGFPRGFFGHDGCCACAGKDFTSLFVVWATGHVTETLVDFPYKVRVYSSDFANASKPGAELVHPPFTTSPELRQYFLDLWRTLHGAHHLTAGLRRIFTIQCRLLVAIRILR
jgi:hypothetical protein